MYRGIRDTCISFAEAGLIRLLLVSKFNVGLKSILHQSLSERNFYVEIKKDNGYDWFFFLISLENNYVINVLAMI